MITQISQHLQLAEPELEQLLPEPEQLRTVQQEPHIPGHMVRTPEPHSWGLSDRRPEHKRVHMQQARHSSVLSEHMPEHTQLEPHSLDPSPHRRV